MLSVVEKTSKDLTSVREIRIKMYLFPLLMGLLCVCFDVVVFCFVFLLFCFCSVFVGRVRCSSTVEHGTMGRWIDQVVTANN